MGRLTHRIEPFRALMYDTRICGDLATVVAPPYDLINSTLQAELYARSPYNIVRLELGREPDRYSVAAQTLRQWREQKILIRAGVSGFYLYTQIFDLEGRRLRREGLIARIRLDHPEDGRILPHEKTFAGPKQDRLQLLSATRVNLSSIFGIYRGACAQFEEICRRVEERAPILRVTDSLGIENYIRMIEAPEHIAALQQALADRLIIIADGHHRYETARLYRAQRRAEEHDPPEARPYDYTMITLTSSADPGLTVLPFHRILRRLDPEILHGFAQRAAIWFELERADGLPQLRARLKQLGAGSLGVVFARPAQFCLMRLKGDAPLDEAMSELAAPTRRLDVSILHHIVFKQILGLEESWLKTEGNIEYTPDGEAAAMGAAEQDAGVAAAFLLNPPSLRAIEEVSEAGATMPEKSTYFFPKLLTGLVINPVDD
jgi:uncharacterized protein (DUF1015 family)